MAIIPTLARTAVTAAELPLRGLQTILDPEGSAESERLSALDRRLATLEDQLKELADLDARVSTLVAAEFDRAVAPLARSLTEVRDDVDHIRTQQAADKVDRG